MLTFLAKYFLSFRTRSTAGFFCSTIAASFDVLFAGIAISDIGRGEGRQEMEANWERCEGIWGQRVVSSILIEARPDTVEIGDDLILLVTHFSHSQIIV